MHGDDFLAERDEIGVVLATLVLRVKALPSALVVGVEPHHLLRERKEIERIAIILRGESQKLPRVAAMTGDSVSPPGRTQ